MTAVALVGRDGELTSTQELLAGGARLVTLWGPPGIGKTRLARALAATPSPRPVMVDLAGAAGAEGLLAAVDGALGGSDGDPPLEQLSGRVLVLDNLEHLLEDRSRDAVTHLVVTWLQQHAALQIVGTSRRRLRVPLEHAVALSPLDTPSSVALFEAHIRRQHPGFDLEAVPRSDLQRLMERLEGIPLAIELAAARFELLGIDGLLERLDEPLEVLAQPQAPDPRHITLRKAIAWSWELLGPAEQEVLTALSTFAGTFDLGAAETVAGAAALDAVEALRDGALLEVPVPGTFRLLSSVRAFAREQLTEERGRQLRRGHAVWCIAETPTPERPSSGSGPAREDLFAAASFLLDQRDPRLSHVLRALGRAAPGHHLDLFSMSLARADDPDVRRARGRALRLRGRFEEARLDFEAGLALASDPATEGALARELGVLHHHRRDLEAARTCYERALVAHRAAGDRWGEAITVGNLGALDHDACRYEDADVRYAEALAGLRAAGDRHTEATFLANRAVLRQEQGQLDAAERAYRRVLTLLEEDSDIHVRAITLGNLGLLVHELGRLDEAVALHHEALDTLEDLPDPVSMALGAARLGAAQASRGQLDAAEAAFDRARRTAAGVRDRLVSRTVALFEGFQDLAAGDLSSVAKRLAEAAHGEPGDPAPLSVSGDARIAARLLGPHTADEDATLRVRANGFTAPRGERQDLSRHASLRRMFVALVDARRTGGDGLDVEALFGAGWPGEAIAYDSMRNRVHVNLAKLRTMGLRGVLVRVDEGYRLDPAVPLHDER